MMNPSCHEIYTHAPITYRLQSKLWHHMILQDLKNQPPQAIQHPAWGGKHQHVTVYVPKKYNVLAPTGSVLAGIYRALCIATCLIE